MNIHDVHEGHPLYTRACRVVTSAYQRSLIVDPTDLPKRMVVVTRPETNTIVGVGGYKLGSELPQFQTERYCSLHRPKLQQTIAQTGANSRSHIAEACTFGLAEDFVAYADVLACSVLCHLSNMRMRALLMTQTRRISQLLAKIGVPVEAICSADLQHYTAPQTEKNAWERRWLKLKPTSSVINLDHAGPIAKNYLLQRTQPQQAILETA